MISRGSDLGRMRDLNEIPVIRREKRSLSTKSGAGGLLLRNFIYQFFLLARLSLFGYPSTRTSR